VVGPDGRPHRVRGSEVFRRLWPARGGVRKRRRRPAARVRWSRRRRRRRRLR